MSIDLLPNSVKNARKIGSKSYFTGKPCLWGHVSKRRTSSRVCVECDEQLYKDNRKEFIAKSKNRYEKLNKENPNFQQERYAATRESQKQYRKKNKIKRNAHHRQWYKDNNDYCLRYAKSYNSNVDPEKKRKQGIKNYRRNKPIFIANAAQYKAAKSNRTPTWLSSTDKEIIKNMYKMAAKISEETGIKHHVDHEIPLRGEFVCGLHVPWNLQILTATENLSKGNRMLSVVV